MRSALTLPKAYFSMLIQCLKGVKKWGLEIMRKTDENYKKKTAKIAKKTAHFCILLLVFRLLFSK